MSPALICARCKEKIGPNDPKIVLEESFCCARCTYLHDHPDKEPQPERRPRPARLQEEKLFDVPQTTRRRSHAGMDREVD